MSWDDAYHYECFCLSRDGCLMGWTLDGGGERKKEWRCEVGGVLQLWGFDEDSFCCERVLDAPVQERAANGGLAR